MKRATLYICYYNVTEPLVRSQVVAYLGELARGGVEVHLLTFEHERLSAARKRAIREELAEARIIWYSLRYHKRPSLPATLYDVMIGTLVALHICRKHRIPLVHARSHVPAAMAIWVKRLLGARFLFDIRGLLAEEYVDGGNWTAGDLKFRLTKGMERAFFRHAHAFVMLTHRIKDELCAAEPDLSGREQDVTVIPCCVDTSRYAVPPAQRERYRREREWDNRKVLVYVGKLGAWYLPDEMARFFAAARAADPRLFFQVLTQSDPSSMLEALRQAGVAPDDYDVRFEPPERLPLVLSACDAAISFIRPCYSKRASSPTKIGEYLAAGLPVVTGVDIGDGDRMIAGDRLGVIAREFAEAEYVRAAGELRGLLEDPDVGRRCRGFAERELSLSSVGGPRYLAVYERLLGPAWQGMAARAAETNRA